MSPTSRKRIKKKRRSTPRREPSPTKVLDETVAAFAGVARSEDALRAEVLTSELLGAWWSAGTEEVGTAAVEHATRVADANALAMLTGLAAMATGDLAAKAAAAAARLTEAGVPAPAWAESIGNAVPGDCWRWGDVFGELETVFCRFDGPIGAHAVCVLIHSLSSSGFAKDAWVVTNPDETLAGARRTLAEHDDKDLLAIHPVDQGEAGRLIENAFRATNFRTDRALGTLPEFRALVLARARLLPDPVAPADLSEEEQSQLVTEFLGHTGLESDGAARRCAERYVAYWSDAFEDPTRASTMMAAEFLQDMTSGPITPAEVGAMPSTVRAFLRWAARRGLSDRAVAVLMKEVDHFAAKFGEDGFKWIDLPSWRTDSYVVRVDLDGAEPPVWRRLRVPGDLTMADLHVALQVAFDWDDSHPHTFAAGGITVGDQDGADFDLDETEASISELAPKPGAKLEYVYDNWKHLIEVEKVEAPDPTVGCLDGRGAAPTDPEVFDPQELDVALRARFSRR